MTGDTADLTIDPIVNLRDAHLIEIYLHLASAHREGHLDTHPEQPAPVATTTKVDIRPSLNSHP